MSNVQSTQPPVLLVDDEPQILRSASMLLRSDGIENVLTCDDSRQVMAILSEQPVALVVLDLTMPNLSGQALLARICADHPDLPVLVVTATNDVETAVQCMRDGAQDYLLKPVDKNRLVSSVRRALEIRGLHDEILSLKKHLLSDQVEQPEAFAEIITQSSKMHGLFRYMEAIARSSQPVLITGDTGTGKELFARAVAQLSGRRGEFVAVNVAGLDDNVFSDTLFGHRKGAFTGADRAREGLIAAADNGTLFLDEIGDLAPTSQVKLLRLLQDRSYYRLGADRPLRSGARVVVATNCDVPQMVQDGRFRKDLYYRLRAHHIRLPSLRERREDLPLLLGHFLGKAADDLGKTKPTPPPELISLLKTYEFPGNIRELEAMTFDAVARHGRGTLSLKSFADLIGPDPDGADSIDTPPALSDFGRMLPEPLPSLKQAEVTLIDEALKRADGNQGIAARMLGMTRQALNKRLVRGRQNKVA